MWIIEKLDEIVFSSFLLIIIINNILIFNNNAFIYLFTGISVSSYYLKGDTNLSPYWSSKRPGGGGV